MISKPADLATSVKPNLPTFSAKNYRIKFSKTRIVFNIILKIPILGNLIKFFYRLLKNRNIFEYTYNAQNAFNNSCFAISQNSNIRIYRANFQDILKNCNPNVIAFSTNENGEFKKGFTNAILSSYTKNEDPPFAKTFPNLTNSNYLDESGVVGEIRQFKPSTMLKSTGVEQLYGVILKADKDKDAPLTKKQLQKTIVSLFHYAIKYRETNKVVINLPLQSCGIDIADTGKYLNNKNSIKQIIATADACMRYQQAIDPDLKIVFNMSVTPEESYGNSEDFNEMLNDINLDYISNATRQAKETNDFLQNDINNLIPNDNPVAIESSVGSHFATKSSPQLLKQQKLN